MHRCRLQQDYFAATHVGVLQHDNSLYPTLSGLAGSSNLLLRQQLFVGSTPTEVIANGQGGTLCIVGSKIL